MNSERRHELQQNDLAVYLNKINKSIEPYSKIIAVGVAVLIVGAIGLAFYRSEQTGKKSEATLQLIQASASDDPEVLLTVSDAYPGTTAADWSRLYQGQLYLSQGMQSLYSDRANAEDLLNDAKQALGAALATNSNDVVLRSRAQFGIARAEEALGNLDEAIDGYKKVIEINESEAMDEKAQERIDALSRPDAKEFMTWFADQNFSPADPSLPPTLPGGDTLPDIPDLNLPPLSIGGDEDLPPRDLDGGIELPEDGADAPAKESDSSEGGLELPATEGTGEASGDGTADAGADDSDTSSADESDATSGDDDTSAADADSSTDGDAADSDEDSSDQ